MARDSSITAALTTLVQTAVSLVSEYLFADAPGKLADYQLIYETPSTVITIPLEIRKFKDVDLALSATAPVPRIGCQVA